MKAVGNVREVDQFVNGVGDKAGRDAKKVLEDPASAAAAAVVGIGISVGMAAGLVHSTKIWDQT